MQALFLKWFVFLYSLLKQYRFKCNFCCTSLKFSRDDWRSICASCVTTGINSFFLWQHEEEDQRVQMSSRDLHTLYSQVRLLRNCHLFIKHQWQQWLPPYCYIKKCSILPRWFAGEVADWIWAEGKVCRFKPWMIHNCAIEQDTYMTTCLLRWTEPALRLFKHLWVMLN